MAHLILLVGLPASGKSTYSKKNFTNGEVIISSDSIRAEKYGDEAIQGDNAELFKEVHSRIHTALNENKDVVYDATNISYKHRVELLKTLPKNVYSSAIVFATPYHVCLSRNNNRSRVVPLHVMERYWKSFTMPQYNEGFDNIDIVYDGFDTYHYTVESFLTEADVFNQDNYHHEHTLGVHCRKVLEICEERSNRMVTRLAGILHDNGKLYTKTFTTMKGEPSTIAHYYGHENVGAYEAMFYGKNLGLVNEDIVFLCGLIQYHMRMYFISTEKAKNKFFSLVGATMFEALMVIHYADKQAH